MDIFHIIAQKHMLWYGKCPKISYTEVFHKLAYAHSADPDHTAPSEAI